MLWAVARGISDPGEATILDIDSIASTENEMVRLRLGNVGVGECQTD
jgi:hypothetical protein